jgi:CheY-specific phosphatase CheX
MEAPTPAIDVVAATFFNSVKQVLESSTKQTIKYSTTIQSIPRVSLRPDIGCFVQFSGDYNGLCVINFAGTAALSLYKGYMTAMGLPEEELAKDHTTNEVPDSIGEMTNQIMGHTMRMVENKYNLTSFFGQPKALALNSSIILHPENDYNDNRRVVFIINDMYRFYLELAMERTEFISLAKRK